MRLKDLEAMDATALARLGLSLGMGRDAYELPKHALARDILIRVGEAAGAEAWDAAAMLKRIADLEDRMESRFGALAGSLRSLEVIARNAAALSEASLMTRVGKHRTLMPKELAALSDRALVHLAISMEVPDAETLPRAALLDRLVDALGWAAWRRDDA